MGDFDTGNTHGRFYWSIIDNPYFGGLSFRIGIENIEQKKEKIFALSMQVAYLMVSIGWII